MEDELREARNIDFMEGKAVHVFTEITAILDYAPAGWEGEEEGERPTAKEDQLDDEELPALDEAEEERLKNDQSLKWDEEEEDLKDDELDADGNKRAPEDKDKEGKDDEEEADDDLKEGESPRRRNGRGGS